MVRPSDRPLDEVPRAGLLAAPWQSRTGGRAAETSNQDMLKGCNNDIPYRKYAKCFQLTKNFLEVSKTIYFFKGALFEIIKNENVRT